MTHKERESLEALVKACTRLQVDWDHQEYGYPGPYDDAELEYAEDGVKAMAREYVEVLSGIEARTHVYISQRGSIAHVRHHKVNGYSYSNCGLTIREYPKTTKCKINIPPDKMPGVCGSCVRVYKAQVKRDGLV